MKREVTVEEFELLYRSTAPELFNYIRRRSAADPENLVAEVFAIAWRRRADLPSTLLRRAWLFGAARRLLLAEARATGRERKLVELSARLDRGAEPRKDRNVEDAVARALGRLNADERELIQLVEWEHLTPAEVSVVLGLRPGTVRVRLHRARQSLAADVELRALVGDRRHRTTPRPSEVRATSEVAGGVVFPADPEISTQ
jgi:RNA polymerase sigma-70 factor (ECF subfamily)